MASGCVCYLQHHIFNNHYNKGDDMYKLTMYTPYSSIEVVTDNVDETLLEYDAKGFKVMAYQVDALWK